MLLSEALEVLARYLAYLQSDDGKWPLERERPILTAINTWVALREGDHEALKRIRTWDARRSYRVDPLAERISDAWSHYLMGEDPIVTPANTADLERMTSLLGSDFPSELERAAGLNVSEGEIWARVYSDPLVAPRPLLDWVSRSNIVPMWHGNRLVAAGVVTELPAQAGETKGTVWRHFEVHVTGHVFNVLYRGRDANLGNRVIDLANHQATSDLEPIWEHRLPGILLERVPNRLRRDRRIGISDYAGILDTLLDLNELAAIGAHNMRLSARQRAVVSNAVAQAHANRGRNDLADDSPTGNTAGVPRPRFDPSEEVFVEDPLDGELGKSTDPFRILSYDFDADALIAWKRDLVETALTRVGLSGQYVGINSAAGDGYAISGTALRLKLIPTDSTGRGKARYWDDAMPRILRLMALVDTLPQGAGGFNRGWEDPLTLPTFERGDGLPEDNVERASVHAQLVNAGLISRETSLRERYPEWDEDRITDELERIKADQAAAPSPMLGGF